MSCLKPIQVSIILVLSIFVTFTIAMADNEKFVHGHKFQDCAECPKMIVVQAGVFMMGSPDGEKGRKSNEGPQRDVKISSFAVGQFEVTVKEWDACVKDGGCGGYKPRVHKRGPYPVANVSWHDAQAYVEWLKGKTGKDYRLLSEAEWEYVARAGTTTPYYFGADKGDRCKYANSVDKNSLISYLRMVCRDGSRLAAVVGSYKPNAFGLYDVHGNVWEWVQDEWHPNFKDTPADGSARVEKPDSLTVDHVLRGGSWSSGPYSMRSAARYYKGKDFRSYRVGFRVARGL